MVARQITVTLVARDAASDELRGLSEAVDTLRYAVNWRRRTKRLERAFIVAQRNQDWCRTNAIAAAYARLTFGGKL